MAGHRREQATLRLSKYNSKWPSHVATRRIKVTTHSGIAAAATKQNPPRPETFHSKFTTASRIYPPLQLLLHNMLRPEAMQAVFSATLLITNGQPVGPGCGVGADTERPRYGALQSTFATITNTMAYSRPLHRDCHLRGSRQGVLSAVSAGLGVEVCAGDKVVYYPLICSLFVVLNSRL